MSALVRRAVANGGFAVGPIEAPDQPSWADELIAQFNGAGPKTRCPHLQSDSAALWIALAPDLLACMDCEQALVEKIEARLGHSLAEEPSRCSFCSAQVPTRGISLAVGRFLLRGLLCEACETTGLRDEEEPDEQDGSPGSVGLLDLPVIQIDFEALRATSDREDFDEKGWELLARAGKLCELLINAVRKRQEQDGHSLNLDEAVIGGLLVRSLKLTRAIFDSTQADESEAHSLLSRCLAETTITLRWLAEHGDADRYRRFRADSFARWRGVLLEMKNERADEDAHGKILREGVEAELARELKLAELTWDDVPQKANSWGPSVRQRFEQLGQGSIYNTLFATHSSYVHPTWHEIRAFHLQGGEQRLELSPSYAGLAPIAAYMLCLLVAEACRSAGSVLSHDLPPQAFEQAVANSVSASRLLSAEFGDFMARGGLDAELSRHWAA